MKLRRRNYKQRSLSVHHYKKYYVQRQNGSQKSLKDIQIQTAHTNSLNSNTAINQSTQQISKAHLKTINSRTPPINQPDRTIDPDAKERIKKRNQKLLSTFYLLRKTQISRERKTGSFHNKSPNSMVNRNTYSQFLSVPSVSLYDIKWVSDLRGDTVNDKSQNHKRGASDMAPEVFFKQTQASKVHIWPIKVHHQVNEIPTRVNFSAISHLAQNHPCIGGLKFQTSLRQNKNASSSKQILKRQKSFSTIHLIKRNQYPKILKKNSLRKKTINPEKDLQSTFDGRQNFPSYSNSIIKQKNYNVIREMLKTNNQMRAKVDLPTIAWQSGLRSGTQIVKKKNTCQTKDRSITQK